MVLYRGDENELSGKRWVGMKRLLNIVIEGTSKGKMPKGRTRLSFMEQVDVFLNSTVICSKSAFKGNGD